ncbi:alpha-xylosidase [Colletotrichum liriopes]|uniref:alpha-D-xyloside xylohydrolase n=1 Tax=Colletotrichum liriopes TaxID=708192 RepID=A0AA37GVH0_9PEZI|nr:alpha-xylosidase [Colletotrichum liriopes]
MVRLRDGMWLPAEGTATEYAEEVYYTTEIEGGKGLSLLCPTRKIKTRGHTLNASTVTLDIKAEFDGVISVEATHWAGALSKGPHFELFPDGRPEVEAQIQKGDKGTTLSSGSLSATIHPDFDIQFHSTDGSQRLTSLGSRSVGLAYNPAPSTPMQTGDMRDFKHYMFTQTTLGVGETIHGLGERFGAYNKVGQSISLWNADGGTSSEQAYKNVSFWLSSKGYGVFIDTPGRVELEIGSERCNRLQTVVEGQRLKWYIIYGPTPKDILKRYTTLTGKAGKVPSWSFGLWLTTSFTTNYDEQTVNTFLEGMKARGSPVDVFHYDCFWMKAFTWTDFVFDSERFPDPKAQIARLKESGLCKKVCVWINPYIAQHGEAFKEAAEKGYLVKRKNGDVWQWDLWQAGMGLVDFTNPEACQWYEDKLNTLFDQGVDSIKTDFGERVPTLDVEWHDKTVDPVKMHNYYAFIYNKVVYEALQKRYGRNEASRLRRHPAVPLQWGGDCESTPEAMAESIRGGLGLGLSGFSFWSCDIGGFEGYPPPWIYKRWVAMGLLCSHSRLHGSSSYRVPWVIDDDDASDEGCSRTLAKWTALKSRLMPYIFSEAQAAVEQGIPLSLRAMCIEFPEDPTSWYLDRQFMLGPSILAAPIFEESGEVEFYLPKGGGPPSSRARPAMGRGGSRRRTVLARCRSTEKAVGAVYDYAQDVEVRLYRVKEGSRATIVDSEGQEVGVLEVGEDGKLKDTAILKGDFNVTEL